MTPLTPAIDVRDLVRRYGRTEAVNGLNLLVEPGRCYGFFGRNGAGKTTTLDSAMGLLPVRSGTVRFRSQDITRQPPHARARLGIGYAPEDCGIFPDLTVGENLQIGRWLAADKGAGAEDRSQTIFPEIEQLTSRRGLNLSGGQKKMLAISRALALAPSVLLLDEPFEGLAPLVVTRFIDAARRIKALGVSLLIAESNVTNAARVADRLYAIDRGEILFEGPPQAALDNQEVMRILRG